MKELSNQILSKHTSLDCLLICPPFVFPDGFYTGQRAFDPPLGVMALAGYTSHKGYSTEIIDCNVLFRDTDLEFEQYFKSNFVDVYSEIRVIGLTTKTPTINACFRISKLCKKYFPNSIVVLGGAHSSFVPDESLDKDYVDCVCIGEGELTLEEVLENKPFHAIDGLAYKLSTNNGIEVIKNKPRMRIKDLDQLPYPAYDMIDLSVYRPIIGNFKRLPAMMVVSSRGCPWSCNFCRRSVGKMWTAKSAQALYDEINYLVTNHGIKDIAIMDDVFTVDKERVFEFCDLLINNPLDMQWKCFARVDIVTPEMLAKMKQAGCWGIMYGVENFNQEVLDGINKGVELKQSYNAVQWAKDADLELRVCMMIGNVGDTKEIIDRNIKLLIEMDADFLALAILTPFPGHGIYNWGVRKDLIMTYDWDQYYGSTPILELETLSPEETYALFKKMARKFYLRPGYIFKRLRKIRSFTELWYNIKGFFGLLKFNLDKFKPSEIYGDNINRNKKFATSMLEDRITTKVNKEKAIEYTLKATKETAIT